MKNVGIFYGRLVQFMTIWYKIWPFGIACSQLVYFFPFWYVWTKKIWQPCSAIGSCVFCVKVRNVEGRNQGCQIYLGSNIPKWEIYTKLLYQTVPDGHKLYQIAIKYSKL
jgi:hypothetical protein